MSRRFPAVLLTGPLGVGKTVVAAELGELLAELGVRAAVIDLDWLGWLAGADGGIDELIVRNLDATWPNYEAAGAERAVFSRSVRDATLPEALRARFDLTVVRLTASNETVAARLGRRDAGTQLAEHLAERGSEADVADVEVANDGAPVRDVAQEVLRRVGWR